MSLGFHDAELPGTHGRIFESVMAVESDPHAAATYRTNFDAHVECRDIQDVPSTAFPRADALIGGPPCQGFSTLNRDRQGDLRRLLWMEYERALAATGASFFVMENVPQLLNSPEFNVFSSRVIERGWNIKAGILNAADYGVPQTRRRAIVIGSLLGEPTMPVATHAAPQVGPLHLLSDVGADWLTVRDAIGDLPGVPDGRRWHRGRNPTSVSQIRYRHVPVGGSRFDMQRSLDAEGLGHLVPRCWRMKTSGTTDVFGRMWWDRPAPTLRTEFYKPEKGRYLHPDAHRPITVREGARLMGFPDDFCFPEEQALTHVGRQIGNAVPPPLARAVAEALAEHAMAVGALPALAA